MPERSGLHTPGDWVSLDEVEHQVRDWLALRCDCARPGRAVGGNRGKLKHRDYYKGS